MKRFELSIRVYELDVNIEFYSHLLGSAPRTRSEHEARWVLDAPPVNLTISARGMTPGLEHLGFQVDTGEELETIRLRFAELDPCVSDEPEPGFEISRDRHWLVDPQGILWAATRGGAEYAADEPPQTKEPVSSPYVYGS